MRHYLLIFITVVVFTLTNSTGFAQVKVSGVVKITFVSTEGDHARTYISKLKKGNLESLREMLKPPPPSFTNEVKIGNEENPLNGYVNRIVVAGQKYKNKRKAEEDNMNDLIGNYVVKDNKELKKVREKKQKANRLKSSANDDAGNYQKYIAESNIKQASQLSKYFQVSTGRRLRNGNIIKKPAGGVTLIITYKIREGKTICTYVNLVEAYLNPGSNYALKYHGTGSKRKYYLEYATNSSN